MSDKQPVGCNIVESLNNNKHSSTLVLPYNYPQMTKKLIGAQHFVNIFKPIVESLSLVLLNCSKHTWPTAGFFLQRRHNWL